MNMDELGTNEAHSCSIVIPLFNQVGLTRACVESLIIANDPVEVLLVDNGSTDETAEYCQALTHAPRESRTTFVSIRNDENLGFAAACNQGARAANSERVLFLNNDTEVDPGWLEPLLTTLAHPEVAAVGAKLLYPDRTIQHAGVVITNDPTNPKGFLASHWLAGVPSDHPLVNERREFQAVTAACMLVERRCFFEAGEFDTSFWNGFEDIDLCLKLREVGLKVMYEPNSVVIHHESASGPERFARADANTRILVERWAGRIEPDVLIGPHGHVTMSPRGLTADIDLGDVQATGSESHTAASPELRDRERMLEQIDTTQHQQRLLRQRGNSDVCWLEGDKSNPLVTIRIATYNRGDLVVERAIESALNQTYENVEVLVIGDHCDGATRTAVQGVNDPRFRFVQLPTQGLYPSDSRHRWMVAGGHPMITALDLARGSWLAPCDDDDELTPDHVEVLLGAAKDRRLEMVWSKAQCEVTSGKWIEIGGDRLIHGTVSHGSVMYSLGLRRILPNVRAWRLDEPGDWNLWRRMRDIGVRMGFVDQMTYVHYVEAIRRDTGDGSPSGARISSEVFA